MGYLRTQPGGGLYDDGDDGGSFVDEILNTAKSAADAYNNYSNSGGGSDSIPTTPPIVPAPSNQPLPESNSQFLGLDLMTWLLIGLGGVGLYYVTK